MRPTTTRTRRTWTSVPRAASSAMATHPATTIRSGRRSRPGRTSHLTINPTTRREHSVARQRPPTARYSGPPGLSRPASPGRRTHPPATLVARCSMPRAVSPTSAATALSTPARRPSPGAWRSPQRVPASATHRSVPVARRARHCPTTPASWTLATARRRPAAASPNGSLRVPATPSSRHHSRPRRPARRPSTLAASPPSRSPRRALLAGQTSQSMPCGLSPARPPSSARPASSGR